MLVIAVGSEKLSRVYRLLGRKEDTLGLDGEWSYPCVYENVPGGIVYISVTNQAAPANAVLVKVPTEALCGDVEP